MRAQSRTCVPTHTGIFALCPAGWGCWSSRFYDAIDQMHIPVAQGGVRGDARFSTLTAAGHQLKADGFEQWEAPGNVLQ